MFTLASKNGKMLIITIGRIVVKRFLKVIAGYLRKTDLVLLLLCTISTIYGIILISSSARVLGAGQYLYIQILSLIIGIGLYVVFSLIDIDIFADRSRTLTILSVVFISTLFIWGVAGDSGNRAWLRFAGFGVQPAEIVKIPFTIVLARQIVDLREKRGINAPLSILQLVIYFGVMFGLIIVSSSDLGSALVYLVIFAVVLFVAGVNLAWFLLAGGVVAAMVPIMWNFFLSEGQKDRIKAPYDPSVDISGLGVRWQANQSEAAISAGGFSGTGLYNGAYTQSEAVPQQHTDFIFSAAGEELGFIGCMIIILLLLLIIIRCIYVGVKSNNTLGMLVCTGFAAMLIFQTFENIGMCIGLTPVIGLTLPFFSYGGSSIIALFASMGIIAGIKMRPKPISFRQK